MLSFIIPFLPTQKEYFRKDNILKGKLKHLNKKLLCYFLSYLKGKIYDEKAFHKKINGFYKDFSKPTHLFFGEKVKNS